MNSINERENDGRNRYVTMSILDNDFGMIMKQNENDEVSKYQKCVCVRARASVSAAILPIKAERILMKLRMGTPVRYAYVV